MAALPTFGPLLPAGASAAISLETRARIPVPSRAWRRAGRQESRASDGQAPREGQAERPSMTRCHIVTNHADHRSLHAANRGREVNS